MNHALKQGQTADRQHRLHLVKKPVQRAVSLPVVREATTGRVVTIAAAPQPILHRVYAVAETAQPQTSLAYAEPAPVSPPRPRPEFAFYRKYTEALLRRYLRISIEVGRVPSVMNRDMFRGNVTHYKRCTLEDGVIFCHDVERVLEHFDAVELMLIRRITLQNYSHTEVAGMVGLSLRGCGMRYVQTLDRLTKLFLERNLLKPLVDPGLRQIPVKGVKSVSSSQVIVIRQLTSEK